MKKKVYFWIPDIDNILSGSRPAGEIGGANVQMAFWAVTFAEKGWDVYATTYNRALSGKEIKGIRFRYFPLIRYVMFVLSWFRMIWLLIDRPSIVVTRAIPWEFGMINWLSKWLNFKHIYMVASDLDVKVAENGQLTSFQKELQKCGGIVVQNVYQRDELMKFYSGKNVPLIPNIWLSIPYELAIPESDRPDVIWVSNLRSIKRPEWVPELAKLLPEYKFAMIGKSQDDSLQSLCSKADKELANFTLLGYRNLFETSAWIGKSKVLLCTSTYEGFPNTFLQAWSQGVPVISTVDPNDLIKNKKMGYQALSIEDMAKAIRTLLEDTEGHKATSDRISTYFTQSHTPGVYFPVFEGLCLE